MCWIFKRQKVNYWEGEGAQAWSLKNHLPIYTLGSHWVTPKKTLNLPQFLYLYNRVNKNNYAPPHTQVATYSCTKLTNIKAT